VTLQNLDASSSVGEHLIAFLTERNVEAELIEPGVPMPTVPLAAAAIGVEEEQIIKSLLFRDPNGDCVLAIASGTARIDRNLLGKVTGLTKLRLANPETVQTMTGFPAGGVSPVGHATPILVVIDRRAAELETVYGGGGTEDVLLRIRPSDIIRITNATIADITSPS
jgi:Cys-tRNA(Pro) deacylase